MKGVIRGTSPRRGSKKYDDLPMDAVTIYTRISKDRAGAGVGVARQEKECRILAEKMGWTVTAVYSDNDLSAYSGKRRDGYATLLAEIDAGRVHRVLAWHTDRLHRSTRELLDYIDLVKSKGVLTHAVQAGPIDLSTATGIATAITLGAWSEHESAIKSERLKSKFAEKAAAGEYSGGVRPFGYEADGVTVRPDEAETVRQATKEILAGGSLRDIARRLNEEGVTSSLGKIWSPNQVKSLVVRARNAGLRKHRGEVVGKAVWPAIVDEADWRSACAILADPSRRTTTTNVRKYLLSGIATCGECGGVITAKWVSSRGNKRVVYECRYSHCVARAQHHVDELVTETVIARLSRDDARDLMKIEGSVGKAYDVEFDTLHGRMDQAAQAFASGAITVQQLTTITSTCQARLDAISNAQAASSRTPVLAALVGADDVRLTWEELSLTRQRAVIDALLTVAILRTTRRGPGFDPESVVIVWR